MSCRLPKSCSENPYIYTREQLVEIAKACGILQIYKKNMVVLCQEITEKLGGKIEPHDDEKKGTLEKEIAALLNSTIDLTPRQGAKSTQAKHGCVDLSPRYKKYRERSSPPYPANECGGKIMKGNDGNVYKSVPNKNGIYSWKLHRNVLA